MSELKARRIGQLMSETGRFDTEVYIKSEADKVISELKDKCQMHDFFWEGCGFAKRGFKNTIAVSEAFDKLKAENVKLKSEADKVIARHKYKRCLDKAAWCRLWYEQEKYEWQLKDVHHWFKMSLFDKWHKRWLELAEKFKEAK